MSAGTGAGAGDGAESESTAEAERRTESIPEWKREEVDELVDFIESYDAVGVVGVAGIPSRQLQSMRRELHGDAEIRMSRNTLAVRALEAVGGGVEALTAQVGGQVALVGTNDNPFGLYRELEASKTPAPINAGEVAPDDVVIPEGDTGVDPGPFVGDLQQVGAAARIDGGSIRVTEDSTVLSADEEVSAQLADVLGELGIEPKEVGLDLRAVSADGVVFEPDELDIDIDAYRADVEAAAARGRNLSVNAAYPTARTAATLIARATGEAKAVGLRAELESPDVVPELIGRADAQLRSLAAAIDDDEALPEELRDVEPPAGDAGGDGAASDAADGEDEDADVDADAADADADRDDEDDEDDEDGDGAEGLGAMFG